jgi:hypothetical protein
MLGLIGTLLNERLVVSAAIFYQELIIPADDLKGHAKEDVRWFCTKECNSSNLDSVVTEDTSMLRLVLASRLHVMRVVRSHPGAGTFAREGTILIIVDSSPGVLEVVDTGHCRIESVVSEHDGSST